MRPSVAGSAMSGTDDPTRCLAAPSSRGTGRSAGRVIGSNLASAIALSLDAMTFAEVSEYLDRMEATRSRNELVKNLAELYSEASAEEIRPITYLIQGRLVPFFEPIEIGMGEKLVIAAIAQASDEPV